MKYKPVIGLEIHLQVKTESKMFCRCENAYFNAEPNTHICPVCFGLPGALPVPNKAAFEKAIKLALALNCNINKSTKFDRKNYFYPDLPKGYQISQFDKPIGENGYVEIEINDDSRRIRIQRLHLEEDTAKSLHSEGSDTLIDFNKSGVPLIEMVTYPDFDNIEEVLAFAKRLRQIVRYTDTSDAEMQKGQMRFELNISLKDSSDESTNLPDYKIEVKNIGSISVLQKVIEFEIERQSKLLKDGVKPKQETRGLKDMSGQTISQRSKEEAKDYRYFPEPDIAPIKIFEEQINQLKQQIPELPNQKKYKYIQNGLSAEQAEIFIEDIERGKYLDEAAELAKGKIEYKEIANWINTDVSGIIQKNKSSFEKINIRPKELIYLLELLKEKKLTATVVKKILEDTYLTKKSPEEIIKEKELLQEIDESQVNNAIDEVIKQNQKVVEDIKKNPNAIKFLVGQVMRATKGKADPTYVENILQQKLN